MSGSQFLQIHYDSDVTNPITGLFALQLHFCETALAFSQYKARFVFSSESGLGSVEKILNPTVESPGFQFVIHTHYLPNGRQSIALEVETPSGEIVWSDIISLKVRNEGNIAEEVRKSLRQSNTPVIIEGPCDSGYYDYSDQNIAPWYDRPDALDTLSTWLSRNEITQSEFSALKQFVDEGYTILPEKIDDSLLEQINGEIDEAIAQNYSNYEYGSSQRLEHLHLKYPGIRKLWVHPTILQFLSKIFQAPALPCQTLTYVFGSQQDAHQDTIHLTPFPAGYMCGVWVALEDVQPESGELEIYPGSHRLPRVYLKDVDCRKVKNGDWNEFGAKVVSRWQQLVSDLGLEKITYRPARGTVLIWHENLMHAGSPRINLSLSRRSIVTHNFASGCIVYYDSTGIVPIMRPELGLVPLEKKDKSQPSNSQPTFFKWLRPLSKLLRL